MKVTLFFLFFILFASIVSAHSEGDAHPHDADGNEITLEEYAALQDAHRSQQRRDWFFFGFGLICGAAFAWALARDRYKKD